MSIGGVGGAAGGGGVGGVTPRSSLERTRAAIRAFSQGVVTTPPPPLVGRVSIEERGIPSEVSHIAVTVFERPDSDDFIERLRHSDEETRSRMIGALSPDQHEAIFYRADTELREEIFSCFPIPVQKEIFENSSAEYRIKLFNFLDTKEKAALFKKIDPEDQKNIFIEISNDSTFKEFRALFLSLRLPSEEKAELLEDISIEMIQDLLENSPKEALKTLAKTCEYLSDESLDAVFRDLPYQVLSRLCSAASKDGGIRLFSFFPKKAQQQYFNRASLEKQCALFPTLFEDLQVQLLINPNISLENRKSLCKQLSTEKQLKLCEVNNFDLSILPVLSDKVGTILLAHLSKTPPAIGTQLYEKFKANYLPSEILERIPIKTLDLISRRMLIESSPTRKAFGTFLEDFIRSSTGTSSWARAPERPSYFLPDGSSLPRPAPAPPPIVSREGSAAEGGGRSRGSERASRPLTSKESEETKTSSVEAPEVRALADDLRREFATIRSELERIQGLYEDIRKNQEEHTVFVNRSGYRNAPLEDAGLSREGQRIERDLLYQISAITESYARNFDRVNALLSSLKAIPPSQKSGEIERLEIEIERMLSRSGVRR